MYSKLLLYYVSYRNLRSAFQAVGALSGPSKVHVVHVMYGTLPRNECTIALPGRPNKNGADVQSCLEFQLPVSISRLYDAFLTLWVCHRSYLRIRYIRSLVQLLAFRSPNRHYRVLRAHLGRWRWCFCPTAASKFWSCTC